MHKLSMVSYSGHGLPELNQEWHDTFRAQCVCGWSGDVFKSLTMSSEDAQTAAVEDGSEHIANL